MVPLSCSLLLVDPVAEAILLSWNFDPWVIIPLLGAAAIYLRGWLLLRKKLPGRFNTARLAAFQSGLLVVFLALTSPIDVFANLLLFIHMTQHILLTMVAPPLLLMGAPMLPLLRGLPRLVLIRVMGPILAIPGLRSLGAFLVRPVVALLSFSITTVAWHVPALYELALRSEFWHQVEHICFFLTGLLFWWPVVQPWPSRRHQSGWAMILYLLAADLVNTGLSAVLCFAERVLYPSYAAAPELWGVSALADQSAAGAIMWVVGSMAFLLPVGWILNELLEPSLVTPPGAPRRGPALSHPQHRDTSSKPSERLRILLVLFMILLSQLIQPPLTFPHHGGVLQFKERSSPFIITLFSENTPVHTGLVELSVLVQNKSGEPLLDAAVGIELTQENEGQPPIETVATRSNAPNKLMYSAKVVLPVAGVWEATVRVRRGDVVANTGGELVVQPARDSADGWLYVLGLTGLLVLVWLASGKRPAGKKESG